jgi:hypothetical protein
MAELLRQHIVAALAPRNAPSFDILATKGTCSVRIRVKTKSHEPPIWQWEVKKDGSIFRELSEHGDFTVLVDLGTETKDLKFYVVPTRQVDAWLKRDFEKRISTPGRNNKPRSPTNPKRTLDQKTHADDLSKYLNRWEKLWE